MANYNEWRTQSGKNDRRPRRKQFTGNGKKSGKSQRR